MTGDVGACLPRAERLRNDSEFEALFRAGARIDRERFLLLCMRAPGPRAVGFAAGRRLGSSVRRSRARRRLREAYRRQRHLLPREGVRLCFVARRGVVASPFSTLLDEVGGALRQASRRFGP